MSEGDAGAPFLADRDIDHLALTHLGHVYSEPLTTSASPRYAGFGVIFGSGHRSRCHSTGRRMAVKSSAKTRNLSGRNANVEGK